MAQEIKAENLVRSLKEALNLRGLANLSSVTNRTLKITQSAVPADGEANMLIRVRPLADDIQRTDAFGLAQRVYVPHIAEILLEEGQDAASLAINRRQLSIVTAELAKRGLGILVYEQAAGANPVAVEADFDTAAKLYEIRDILFPAIGEM
jgi:hypothetical protein